MIQRLINHYREIHKNDPIYTSIYPNRHAGMYMDRMLCNMDTTDMLKQFNGEQLHTNVG